MSMCAWCEVRTCKIPEEDTYPRGCPQNEGRWLETALEEYEKEENRRMASIAAWTEKTGYCEWTRLQEIAEFCEAAGFTRIGLAFCGGLRAEARVAADYYRKRGLEVISAVCSVGGVGKDEIGIPPEYRFRPDVHESMCNPIGQALICNEKETDFNVVLGLCVGHDSLFFKYADAPTTVLAAKDRVLGHNPLAAVYLANSYYRKLHQDEGKK